MGKPKKTKEEIKEKKRLAARQRRERIKNDPVLYQQSKEKEKERYNKRKREKKLLPVCEMSPKNRKKTQKRNRENFRAYYKRQKEKLETIEEEVVIDQDKLDVNIQDPLETPLSPLPLYGSEYSLRSKKGTKRTFSQKRSEKPKLENEDDLLQQSTSFKTEVLSNKIPNSNVCLTTSTPRPSSAQSSSSVDSILLLHNDKQLTENIDTSVNFAKQSSSLCSTPAPQSEFSAKSVKKSKRRINSPSLQLRRYIYKTNKEMSHMRKKIEELKKDKEKYRKQAFRLKFKNTLQIKPKQDYKKENELKCLQNSIAGKTVEKIKQDVEKFIEQDENSRICPGKREFISRKKIKKQKRFLTNTLLNLHTKFLQVHSYKISYSTFCKLRPFWVVIPDSRARETCMCKTHTNMDLIITSLKRFDIIDESSAHKVLSSLCCDSGSVECLARRCLHCANRTIHFKEFDNTKQIFYCHWTTKRVIYTKDGKEKTSNQTLKEKITANPKDVIQKFNQLLLPYMSHCANKVAQNSYIQRLKENLPENDCAVHVDYSENYNTKYTDEIQSFHFGGSRKQITLHTSVIHYKRNGKFLTQSFCTLSTSLRHDAVAVWSHLMPILNFIKNEAPQVNAIHFISDSPTGQYRNKKMFYVISKLHWNFPNLRVIGWNYTESGHGKSSADGVGATVKRTADRIVAQGCDIVDIETLSEKLRANVKGVITEIVHEADILQKDLLIPNEIREFKGTMKVHQVVWSSSEPNLLAMRKLSCSSQECMYQPIKCEHGKHHGFYSLDVETAEENKSCPDHRFIISAPSRNKNTSRPIFSATKYSDKPKILSNQLVKAAKIFPGSSNSIQRFEKEESSFNLSDTDSFWAPVSPVNVTSLTMPSFATMTEANVPNNSITDKKKKKIFFDTDDSDEDTI